MDPKASKRTFREKEKSQKALTQKERSGTILRNPGAFYEPSLQGIHNACHIRSIYLFIKTADSVSLNFAGLNSIETRIEKAVASQHRTDLLPLSDRLSNRRNVDTSSVKREKKDTHSEELRKTLGELPPEVEKRAHLQPEKLISERIEKLDSEIPEKSKGFGTTMAAGVAEDESGKRFILISTNEKGDHLRKGVELGEGETLVQGVEDGHAEIKMKEFAEQRSLRLITIGATRPICDDVCEPALKTTGTTFSTELKSKTRKSKYE